MRSYVVIWIPLLAVTIACGGDSTWPSAACANIAGSWDATESALVTCPPAAPFPVSVKGPVTISQSGCSVTWSLQGVPRTGTVTGNTLRVSGPLAVSTPGITFTSNVITDEGPISQDAHRLDVTGAGQLQGTIGGAPVTCTVTSTASAMR
jgi:hypothetical protein